MKKSLILALGAMFSLTVLCAAEIAEFPEKADWRDSPNLKTLPDDVLLLAKGVVTSTEMIKTDPAKTTILSGEFRCPEPGKKVRVYFAFKPADAKKDSITAYHVNIVPGTDTELTAPVKKGDMTILVKDGSKFRAGTKVVFNTKEDYSDLPNKEVSHGNFKTAEKLPDGTWKITLTLKMHKDYPAGTKVRLHANGGYQYVSIIDLADTNWKSTKGTVKGMVKKGMGGRMWTPGTAYANIVIFTNGKAPIQFRNIKLEVKD
ncbi:MAG: hypothetical protein IKA79_05790 [Lentisphaeria bacterium]|nr:hypothetical protein [Lentisphaeria bacterium]